MNQNIPTMHGQIIIEFSKTNNHSNDTDCNYMKNWQFIVLGEEQTLYNALKHATKNSDKGVGDMLVYPIYHILIKVPFMLEGSENIILRTHCLKEWIHTMINLDLI